MLDQASHLAASPTDSTGMEMSMLLRKNKVLKKCRSYVGVAVCF